MTKLRVLIVDDEPVARRRLRRLLSENPSVELIGEAADGPAAIAAVRSTRPDVVLLDIQMAEMSGLEVVDKLGRPRPYVVFVTAHDAYAVRAFELHALDYLLKPVTGARLTEAMARAEACRRGPGLDERFEAWSGWMASGAPAARLPIHRSGRIDFVTVASIDWIESHDNYVVIHCGAKRHIMRETLAHLEQRLDSRQFQRIHRSSIVRRDRIVRMEPIARGDWRVTLTDGTTLTVSRTYRTQVVPTRTPGDARRAVNRRE